MLSRTDFDLLTRRDLYTFVQRVFLELHSGDRLRDNWHIELMCAELTALWRGEERRLIFNLPPRNLKSEVISIAFVAWVLGHDPTRKVMVASYGQELAEKFARDTRQVMLAAWYKALFPATRISQVRSAAYDFETTAGGGRMAVSKGGPITGRGADLIILDDPMKADEIFSEAVRDATNDWATQTLPGRTNDKAVSAMILAMQRLHEDDVAGRLIKTGLFKLISLPAIATADETWSFQTPFGRRVVRRAVGDLLHPSREPKYALEETRTLLGEHAFSAQYQQQPIPISGALVKIDRLQRYTEGELPAVFDETILSVDTAFKATDLADYSVVTRWGRKGRRLYLLGVWRWKATYHELKFKLNVLAESFQPTQILIEDCASGQSLIQELQRESRWRIKPCKPTGDKATRMMQAAILIENGDVYIPDAAPWLAEYLHELAAFPATRYDDQVDSTSQALNYFRVPEHGIFAYFREQAELAQRELEPSAPSVWMKPPQPGVCASGIDGTFYSTDPRSGLLLVREEDVASLRIGGCTVVDAPRAVDPSDEAA